jgi:ubiquinone/menaquinone biosynthesis C-methylase UbiE
MPPRQPWSDLESTYRSVVLEKARTYASPAHAERDRLFVLGRFAEGRALSRLLAERFEVDLPLRILDLGTGNAGVAIALANGPNNTVVALDHRMNQHARRLARESNIPLRFVVAAATRLPLSDATFDVVLCLETLEHISQPDLLGREVMRVLKPGGLCVLTTPARIRFLFRADPHFGVPGLLLLPDSMQRWVVTRLLRIVPVSEYDVAHIYWYAGTIARFFPSRAEFQAIGDPPEGRLARRLWSAMQRFVWQRCIVKRRSSC